MEEIKKKLLETINEIELYFLNDKDPEWYDEQVENFKIFFNGLNLMLESYLGDLKAIDFLADNYNSDLAILKEKIAELEKRIGEN